MKALLDLSPKYFGPYILFPLGMIFCAAFLAKFQRYKSTPREYAAFVVAIPALLGAACAWAVLRYERLHEAALLASPKAKSIPADTIFFWESLGAALLVVVVGFALLAYLRKTV